MSHQKIYINRFARLGVWDGLMAIDFDTRYAYLYGCVVNCNVTYTAVLRTDKRSRHVTSDHIRNIIRFRAVGEWREGGG